MQKAVILVSLLLLGWSWTLQGVPVVPDPLYPTQENFALDQFLGTWHDVAVASTCPFAQRLKSIGELILQQGTTEGKLMMTRRMLKQGKCKEISGDYELTTTPGRFLYHVARWGADVDAYVVNTNYNEYAVVIMSKQKASGNKCTTIKLYSRGMTVTDTVMNDFKTLVREQGMTRKSIVIKQNKGDCVPVPGEQVEEPSVQPEPERVRRSVVPSLAPADIEGSGDDTVPFNGTEACGATPDTGPCFGMQQRYYYNSSSMSCELFNYGGCLGNQNNFENERECLQRCRTEAVCRLPMVPQPCTGQSSIWAFDSTAGLCVPYKQGFCQGNANKFYSKAECDEYCGVMNDEGELLKAN